jgi:hypothetical protein
LYLFVSVVQDKENIFKHILHIQKCRNRAKHFNGGGAFVFSRKNKMVGQNHQTADMSATLLG